MSDRLTVLTEKVEEVLRRLEQLKSENASLKNQSRELQMELTSLNREYKSVMLEKNDQSEKLRSKLSLVLERLNQLESLIK